MISIRSFRFLKYGLVEIIKTSEEYLRVVGRHGGYILSEGFGVMAETPPEHIDAMVEASRRVGWIGSALQV